MIVNKITHGYVIQKFDSETKEFLGQEFVSSFDVVFEDDRAEILEGYEDDDEDYYRNYLMVQP